MGRSELVTVMGMIRALQRIKSKGGGMGKTFKILSIDGGGIRGIYPAHVLRCIEERLRINLYSLYRIAFKEVKTGRIRWVEVGKAVFVPFAK
jgi:hypothetical protein